MNSSGNIFGFYQVKHVIWMLTFMGGLYDAAGYFKLQGLFTSSVTGNLISACANIEYPDTNIAKTCVTVAFFVSAGLATVLSINFKLMVSNSNRKCTILLFSVYAVCLTVAWIVGAYLEDQISDARLLENQDDSSVVLVGSLMAATMGVHNIAAREALGASCPPTTVMTSTLINVASNLFSIFAHSIMGESEKVAEFRLKLESSIIPLLFFILGTCTGGIITTYFAKYLNFNLVPLLICFGIISDLVARDISDRQLLQSLDYSRICERNSFAVGSVDSQNHSTYGTSSS